MTKHLLHGVKETVKPLLSRLPYGWRRGSQYKRWRGLLQTLQFLTLDEIQEWQLRHLKEIVTFAYTNTNGYRELFAQNRVTPRDIRSLSDVSLLPFTTKSLLQDNIEDFSVANPLRFYTTTGGSTGIPFGFYVLYENSEIEDAFVHNAWSSAGWREGQLNAVLRGGFVGSETAPWKLDRYRNELLLSSYYLSPRTLEVYIDTINRFRPRALEAYPSALNILCDLLTDLGRVGELSFDLILLGSENTYEWMLEKFERTFPDAKLFSWYGHSEQTIFAPWCDRSRNYHVSPFYGFAEVLGADDREVSSGDEGELVGTSFHMRATPFIRYKTMDRAVKDGTHCQACGRSFRLLERVVGRSQEVIVTATGRYISMTALNMHSDVFDRVRQFQFYQDEPGRVMFRVKRKDAYTDADTSRIYSELRKKLGSDMNLEIAFVDEIPPSPSGKYRFLEQKLPIVYNVR